ncbi:MAG: hypothetical protein LBQ57_10015 [Spirochaetales bacterium]|jgi:hypothetical protein|nr:hypothetical protein [Spirochaetales bacterium]
MKAGENFDIADNDNILKINSPRDHVGGPFSVVYKSLNARWAIVALAWDGQPMLGLRYFWGTAGNPCGTWATSTWLVIPPEITLPILNGLPLAPGYRNKLEKFLNKEIPGEELKT